MKKVVLAALILLAGCNERDELLPNGYRFVELSQGNGAIITTDGNFAVYPNVVEHQVHGSIIVGKRALAPDNSDGSAEFSSGLGYFIFDTATGHLRQGFPQPVEASGS